MVVVLVWPILCPQLYFMTVGVPSLLQAEVGRGCSSSRGKRLRSVSLEKLSLEDMQSKRSSLHKNASEDKISSEFVPLVANSLHVCIYCIAMYSQTFLHGRFVHNLAII